VELSPSREESFLRGVFAGGKVTQDAERHAADHRLMTGDNLHERALITAPRGVNQFGVGGAVFPVRLSRVDHIASHLSGCINRAGGDRISGDAFPNSGKFRFSSGNRMAVWPGVGRAEESAYADFDSS
jgi:hypothetical protein